MENNSLIKELRKLGQGSRQSVQNGHRLDEFDSYMHVDRPIDRAVREEMCNIRKAGGGILFLVGSAGDGKSHMIAALKDDFPDFDFRNDASESPWPSVRSIDALKIFLRDFKDTDIAATSTKMLVAINMGKLSAFIDDEEVRRDFKEIVEHAKTLFDDDNLRHDQSERVKIVSFANHQIFELYPEKSSESYPVDSEFIRKVLAKITGADDDNIFYKAFRESDPGAGVFDPVYVNYQLLCLPGIQDAIVRYIIEAIVRFRLTPTPRELFDFIYRIVVPDNYAHFAPDKDFFDSLLPSRIFGGGENRILRSLAQLDPIKQGCMCHNDELSELFVSVKMPEDEIFVALTSHLHPRFFGLLDEFYNNNRKNISDISRLLFRLRHLLEYHSESDEYRGFLKVLCGYYSNDEDSLSGLYELIQSTIPHFYGSYTDKYTLVPLAIQGREYKMFVSCDNLKPMPDTDVPFDEDNRNRFVIEIDTRWKVRDEIPLKVEYPLYEYLCRIRKGKLAQTADRNHNLKFSEFIARLVLQTDFRERVVILTSDNKQLTLSRSFGKKITLK